MSIFSPDLIRYVLRAAVRDRVLLGLALLVLFATGLSVFMGSAALSEKPQFVSVYMAGSLRLVCVLGLTMFSVLFLRRSFDARDVDYILSRPVSRLTFLASHALAFTVLSFVLSALIVLVMAAASFRLPDYNLLLWGTSLALETTMMVNSAIFFALVIPSGAASMMACTGLYVLARLIGQALGILDRGGQGIFMQLLGYMVEGISFLVPRLDLLTQTGWLIYGPQGAEGFAFVIAQALTFTALILSAAYYDLARRQF